VGTRWLHCRFGSAILKTVSNLPITYSDILAAHERIAGVVHRTPILTSRIADQAAQARVFFKCENFQRAGAFKLRGAYNALVQLSPQQKEAGVVAYSSGNHAQAVALAAKLLAIKAVIVMPTDAPAAKMAATRAYGGEIVLYDRYVEDREALARRLAEQQGLTLIPPFDHPRVMAGQGTTAKEIFEDAAGLDVLFVPLGGGGLLSGCAVATRAIDPKCTLIGVEPEAGNDGERSFKSGSIVHIDVPKTIADGAQTQHLGRHTFPVIRELVDDVITVSDADLIETMRFFASRMKLVVEPTGCLGAAAVIQRRIDVTGKNVGVVISGGNIDMTRFAEFLLGR
jgi:threo-3-hydroxy-L-aspartate ammonia-lyase